MPTQSRESADVATAGRHPHARSPSRAPATTTSRTSTSLSRSACFIAVTGVSGSGKSSLVNEVLYNTLARKLHRARTIVGAHDDILGLDQIDKVINVDQDPIGNSPSSNPGHLHRRLRSDPPALRPVARVAKCAATRPSASASTSRAAAARPARATARRRSRCTSCPTSGSSATSATAAATTPRRWPCATRASSIADVLTMRVSRGAGAVRQHSRRFAACCKRWPTWAWIIWPWARRRRRFRRRGPARQAGRRAGPAQHRQDALPAR